MSDNLTVFNTNYTGVTGIKAKGTGNGTLTYIRPTGTKSITVNGTSIDVTNYSSVDVSVPSQDNTLILSVALNNNTNYWEVDHTYSEISTAIANGKNVVMKGSSSSNVLTECIWDTSSEVLGYAVYYSVDSVVSYQDIYTLSSTGIELNYRNTIRTPSGTVTIKASGYTDVTNYANAYVAAGGATASATKGTVSNHSITVTPSVTRTAGYITAGTTNGTAATVSASELVSGTYTVDSGGTKDVTNYANASVPSGSATASATKGSVSNHSVSVTPSVTRTAGWVTAGTSNGTAVTVSASELVSGTYTVDSSGTKDVTNYASASVAAGSATASATKGTVSNHSVTVTPSVTRTAGWVSAGSANGTAVTVSASELVSGTKSITANGTSIDVTNYANVDVAVDNNFAIELTYNSQTSVWEPDCTFNEAKNAFINNKNIVSSINYPGTNSSFDGYNDLDDQIYYSTLEYDMQHYAYISKVYIWRSTGEINEDTSTRETRYDTTTATAIASDVANGKLFFNANGRQVGTASGGGGDSYTLTTILAQRTLNPDSQHWVEIPASNWIETPAVGEYYLVTFDGTKYLCTGGSMWDNEVVFGDDNNLFQNDTYMVPFAVDYSIPQQVGTIGCVDTNQHTIKIEHFEFVDGPLNLITKSITSNGTYNASSDNADGYSSVTVDVAGGSATYRLDNIVPEQTVACTTFMQNNAYYGMATFSAAIEDSEQYLVTFDGTEYVCEGYVPESNATGVGDIRVANTNSAQNLITPFFIEYQTSLGTGLVVRGSGTHTVKVDKLTFIDDGETFTTKTITENGTYNASSDNADGYSSVTVNVPSSGGTYQAKTNISPTTFSQTIRPDSGYDALSSVQINAMPSGTAGTPSATKGSVSNHSIAVTPSVTNTTGYITGSTKTGTAVTVSASELVSGSETKTANGTYDVTNLASLVVSIPIVTYHTSSSAPTSSQGSNGDLWLVTA